MSRFLILKEQIKKIYNAYSMFILPGLKFILTLVSLIVINSQIGYMNLLNNVAVEILVSLLCMFLPMSAISLVLSLIVVGNLYGLSMYASLAAIVVYIMLYLIFFRFTPKQAIFIMAVPILFILKIPYLIPIIAGLVLTPLAIIPVTMGLFVYFMISNVSGNASDMAATALADPIGLVQDMIISPMRDEAFIVTFIAFSAVIICVYVIRRLSIDFSHYIAIGVGGVLNIIIMLVGSLRFEMAPHVSVVSIIFGGLFCIAVALVADFFILTVDYNATEYVQYEDDDYYYYVKAVPKINVTAPEVSVKRINARKVKRTKKEI